MVKVILTFLISVFRLFFHSEDSANSGHSDSDIFPLTTYHPPKISANDAPTARQSTFVNRNFATPSLPINLNALNVVVHPLTQKLLPIQRD